MRVLCLAGLPRFQSFASVLLCQGSCLADRSHTPSTYPLGTMADQTATVFRHCQQGFLGSPLARIAQFTSNARGVGRGISPRPQPQTGRAGFQASGFPDNSTLIRASAEVLWCPSGTLQM